MPVSPARRVAYHILLRVESGPEFAADLLRTPLAAQLAEPDQALATELVLGCLRRRAELDEWIRRLSGKPLKYFDPEVVTLLRLAVYQIRRLERVPKSAAVNEAVEMAKAARKRSAAGLVNAVLRKCPAARESAPDLPSERDALRLALPDWLRERWIQRFGAEAALELARWSLETPRTAIRIVDSSVEPDAVQRELAAEGLDAVPSALTSRALIVRRGSITRSKPWQTGRVVIQDVASQLVGSLVRPEPGHRVLDLCAAPGMKTAQIASDLSHGLLITCDRSATRLANMARVIGLAIPQTVRWHRVQLDATYPLPFREPFDRILVDAPCSGTGTLARNPEIKWRLKPGDLLRFSHLQTRMLTEALRFLAPGGRLAYATCSLEAEENEVVVENVLNASAAAERAFAKDARLISAPCRRLTRAELVRGRPELDPLFDERGYLRTRPDLHETDGFFACVLSR